MDSKTYLAMTSHEFHTIAPLPQHIAWMACHFSPYGTWLSNLPTALPPGSILILNDRIPFCCHDAGRIEDALSAAAEALELKGILLDFQQENQKHLQELAAYLVTALPCPVAVSEQYAHGLDCPVFLAPCPHHVHLAEHIAPWQGRKLWLDLAVDGQSITVTRSGSQIHGFPLGEIPTGGHPDKNLHCHYSIEETTDSLRFTLWRTPEDLAALAKDAAKLGIHVLVGLYQEWQNHILPESKNRSGTIPERS